MERKRYEHWLNRVQATGIRHPKNPFKDLPPNHSLSKLRIKRLKIELQYIDQKITLAEYQDLMESLGVLENEERKKLDEPMVLPDCCFYPKWVPTSQKTKTERAWKCYNCWEVKWMPLDFKLDQMSEKISESTKLKMLSKNQG